MPLHHHWLISVILIAAYNIKLDFRFYCARYLLLFIYFPSHVMSKPSLLVLYGSQTGTAQDTAQRMVRQAKRRRLQVQAMPLDNYKVVSKVQRMYVKDPLPVYF